MPEMSEKLEQFKCLRCHEVLAETNGNFVRIRLQGLTAEVYISRFEFLCPRCKRVRVWRSGKKSFDDGGKKC